MKTLNLEEYFITLAWLINFDAEGNFTWHKYHSIPMAIKDTIRRDNEIENIRLEPLS